MKLRTLHPKCSPCPGHQNDCAPRPLLKVPEHLTYDDFWTRYFFRAEKVAKGKAGGGVSFPNEGKVWCVGALARARPVGRGSSSKPTVASYCCRLFSPLSKVRLGFLSVAGAGCGAVARAGKFLFASS